MNDSSHTQAGILLIKAAEDEAILDANGIPESILGFHAQQAIEKLIKALLSALLIPFELTHNLDRLRIALEATGETLPSTPLSLASTASCSRAAKTSRRRNTARQPVRTWDASVRSAT